MTRTRFILLVGLVVGLGGFGLAATSLQAAKPADTLNPGIPTKPTGPAIQQPIKYSHKLHAGDLQIDCAYCHSNVDKSAIANIPNVETCMNCHKYVRSAAKDKGNPNAEIAKLVGYYEKNQTIPWLNVHFVPEHANFNHKRHVKAGVQCQTCHGPIQAQEVVATYNKINMGWCVTCHKNNRENPAAPANLDCYTCHK
jgi:hypothetical protein